jgi:outer membrane protein assembly factor BamA
MGFKLGNIFLSLFIPICLSAQKTIWRNVPADSLKDLTEVVMKILHKDLKAEKAKRKQNTVQIGLFPAIGYTLQTGFAAAVSTNAVFYRRDQKAEDSGNSSTVRLSVSYSQKNQIIVPLKSTLFFNKSHTILISDWRYLKYPTYTYGLGMYTGPLDSTLLNYQYLKLQSSVLFQVHPHVYMGGGYILDYFWNIKQVYQQQTKSDFQKYGSGPTSLSSGVTLNFRFDTRDNPVNAFRGIYTNIILAPRFKFLGSNTNWTSLIMDFRTYIRFPGRSPNILAFWSYNWFTLSGTPPYLMLPTTGWDFSTGRGYIQGRFRSNNMLDAETEYRVQLTRNGLLGMVAFANFQSFSTIDTWQFPAIAPGGGLGLRLKLNKYSRTNVDIDYGWGRQGSHGFFVNLAEVF